MPGSILTFDDGFGAPYSEIVLASGEHVHLAIDRTGLVIKRLALREKPERILFKATPDEVSRICAGVFDDQGQSRMTPLKILVAVAVQLPDAATVEKAFKAAADAAS